jgi:phage terminase large subunit GpA-like protein
MGDEFFKQLTAEQLVTRVTKGGYRKQEWQKIRERNEALDTRIYARAAAIVLGIDRFREKQWKQIKEQVAATSAQERTKAAAAEPPPEPPKAQCEPIRRVIGRFILRKLRRK